MKLKLSKKDRVNLESALILAETGIQDFFNTFRKILDIPKKHAFQSLFRANLRKDFRDAYLRNVKTSYKIFSGIYKRKKRNVLYHKPTKRNKSKSSNTSKVRHK